MNYSSVFWTRFWCELQGTQVSKIDGLVDPEHDQPFVSPLPYFFPRAHMDQWIASTGKIYMKALIFP